MSPSEIRAVIAIVAALGIVLVMGPALIPWLHRLKAGQTIRDDGPQSHLNKAGTPTMGGIMMISAVLVVVFMLAGWDYEALAALLALVAFGAIGFWDDYIKVVLRRSLGLRARVKIVLQLLLGVALIIVLQWLGRGTEIIIPFCGAVVDLGWFYYPFILFVLVGTPNAVNLTDGLDGLAAGVVAIVMIPLLLICLLSGHNGLAVFCGAMIGACVGFLVFNHHPAHVFMGDTGSMALGGGMVMVAAIAQMEILLVVIGAVLVAEAMSDIIQVASFKSTGKRVFLMAPLHHHYELKGWSEQKVVLVFWTAAAIFAVIGFFSIRAFIG